jgi:hypothetical protein
MHRQHTRPIRSETRATLVAAIARGRRWLDELTSDPSVTTESIAKREDCSIRKVNMTISLAFLAPDLVKAAIDGRRPHGMGVADLTDLPCECSGSSNCSVSPRTNPAFEPSLYHHRSLLSGNATLQARDKDAEMAAEI